jgi:hypothetical protein
MHAMCVNYKYTHTHSLTSHHHPTTTKHFCPFFFPRAFALLLIVAVERERAHFSRTASAALSPRCVIRTLLPIFWVFVCGIKETQEETASERDLTSIVGGVVVHASERCRENNKTKVSRRQQEISFKHTLRARLASCGNCFDDLKKII